MRSMITAYFCGSSIRTPPTSTNSAATSSTFMELIFSTSDGGNVFSIPNKTPIFFTVSSPNKICHPQRCHPERSDCFAKRSNHAVERSLHSHCSPLPPQGILTAHLIQVAASQPPKNVSPPYSTTTASHASNYPRKHPANAARLSHLKSPRASHSDPGKYPNRPSPTQSSSAGSGSKTNRHSGSANNPADS